MQQVAFYSPHSTPRLSYILLFLTERLGVEFKLYQNEVLFNNWEGAKINYSSLPSKGLTYLPQGLLFENDVQKFDFSSLKNDPFARMFFLLSRYEEYLITERDKHGRFQAKSSYLYQINQLQKPVVDIEVEKLKDSLKRQYPFLNFKQETFSTQLTIDIDQAFLYRHKSFKRFLGATLRDVVNLKILSIIQRKLSYFGLKSDPFDIYDEVKTKFKNAENLPIFFFQIGDHGPFDKNLNFKNKGFQKVIKNVSEWTKVDLHPSYASNQSFETLETEQSRLSDILQTEIKRARQHYIKLHLPDTYRNYLKAGILHDYSMGFADDIGFRAGTSRSFLWYDLLKEETTSLRVHPFCVMDVTLQSYLMLSVEEADAKMKEMQNVLRQVNGKFCMICHNESLSHIAQWQGWREAFYRWVGV